MRLPHPPRVLLWPLVIAAMGPDAACDDDDKETTDVTDSDADTDTDADSDADSDTDPGNDYRLEVVDTTLCARTPSVRHFAHTAWFRTPHPRVYRGEDGLELPVERGFFLHGGVSWPGPGPEDGRAELSGTPLDDLWLFDASNQRDCPWIHLSDAAIGSLGGARWGGAFFFDDVAEEFVLAWGEQVEQVDLDGQLVTARIATGTALTVPLSAASIGPPTASDVDSDGVPANADCDDANPAVGDPPCDDVFEFTSFGVPAGQPRTFLQVGDIYCSTTDWFCIDDGTELFYDPCVGGDLIWPPAQDTASLDCTSWNGTYADPGCAVDPFCDAGVATGDWDPVYETRPSFDLAHPAWVVDPILGVVEVYGGSRGASRGLSSELWDFTHPGLSAADRGALHAANLDGHIRLTLGANPSGAYVPDPGFVALGRPDPWPIEPRRYPDTPMSSGLRHAAGVALGLRFDRATLDYDPTGHTGVRHVLVGGTLFQELLAAQEYDIRNETKPGCTWPFCGPCNMQESEGRWRRYEMPTFWSETDQALGVTDLTGDAYPWAGTMPPRFSAAAVAVEPEAFVVFGGRDDLEPTGTRYAQVFDRLSPAGSNVSVPAGFAPRYGAIAAADPVTASAYVFGGSQTDGDIYRLTSANTLAPNADSTWAMQAVELSLIRDGNVWHVEEAFEAVHHCQHEQPDLPPNTTLDPAGADACFASELELLYTRLPQLGEGVLPPTAHVTVEYRGSAPVELEERASRVEDTGTRSVARGVYRLPWSIPDGGRMIVRVGMDIDRIEDAGSHGLPGLPLLPASDTLVSSSDRARVVSGLPVVLVWRPAGEPTTNALVDVRAVLVSPDPTDPTYTVVGAGTAVGCSGVPWQLLSAPVPELANHASCFTGLPPTPGLLLEWAAVQGLIEVTSRPIGGTRVRVLLDDETPPPFHTASLRGSMDRWATGTAPGDLDADIAYLESHLGPLPDQPELTLVLVPYDTAWVPGPTVAAGQTHPGWQVVSTGNWRSISVHELAHQWLGMAVTADAEAWWVIEALPSLLETMRFPSTGDSASRFSDAVSQVVRLPPDNSNLELLRTVANEIPPPYTVGAHTLAHAEAGARALGLSWLEVHQAWTGFLATRPPGLDLPVPITQDCGRAVRRSEQFRPPDARPTIVHDDLASFFDVDLLQPEFHCEWIHTDRVGTPLLGIERFDTNPPRVVVSQFQPSLKDWPLFTFVPFHLACESVLTDDEPSFEECTATVDLYLYGPPLAVGTPVTAVASEEVTLTRNPVVPNPLPVWLGLLGSEQLLPDEATYRVGYGVIAPGGSRAPTFLQRCDLLTCAGGADSDFYPPEMDCDDTDGEVHPDADVGSWLGAGSESIGGIDLNCDGWPTADFD